MRQRTFIIMLAFVLGWSLYSCKEYTDDLRDLGKRAGGPGRQLLEFPGFRKAYRGLGVCGEKPWICVFRCPGE